MSTSFLGLLIYLLGFIGLISVGLLPLRFWQVLRSVFRDRSLRRQRKVLAVFAVLVATSALWSDVRITVRIFKCLTGSYCGPNVASGWTYLAMLGVIYLAFETIIFVIRKVDQAVVDKIAM
jgi:hypothetical protein